MHFEDFIIAPQPVSTEKWQLGSRIQHEIPDNGIAMLFVSDCRGAALGAETFDFAPVREYLYRLSALDFELPVADLGDLISGKTPQDTVYILQEVLSACHYRNTVPVVIGGSSDLSLALFSALNFHHKHLRYTHLASQVSLAETAECVSINNFLTKIFSTRNFSLNAFHLLGYQKHLNDPESLKLIKDVDFDVVRLADMMQTTEKAEPFFRRADLVTVDCDAVESIGGSFSLHPQVNGLNRREICAYMKEAGLSENLKSIGIFNFNFEQASRLHQQLLAQMVWHLIEGINVQRTHPKERSFETYHVMVGDQSYTFKRDTFSSLWYFGGQENIDECIACSREDYEQAKKGFLNARFLK